MEIYSTNIPDVKVLEPVIHGDARGYFMESFSQREFNKVVTDTVFVQDNESVSSYGVIRGLHFQKGEHSQAKLIRVIEGKVLDVAVDLRKDSPTFGKHVALELSGENKKMIFIPKGFAHGFSVLSERVVFQYKCDSYYAPDAEGGVAWNDPDLGIDWKIPAGSEKLSPKDMNQPSFKDCYHF